MESNGNADFMPLSQGLPLLGMAAHKEKQAAALKLMGQGQSALYLSYESSDSRE